MIPGRVPLACCLAAILLVTGCSALSPTPRTSQGGPLTFGNDVDGPTANSLCGPLPAAGTEVNFGDVVLNNTSKPATIRAVQLVDPVNLTAGNAGAWDVAQSGGQFYWSTDESAGDQAFDHLSEVMGQAADYTLAPGAQAGISVRGVIAAPRTHVAVGRLRIDYSMDGRDYSEVSNVSYELIPGKCRT